MSRFWRFCRFWKSCSWLRVMGARARLPRKKPMDPRRPMGSDGAPSSDIGKISLRSASLMLWRRGMVGGRDMVDMLRCLPCASGSVDVDEGRLPILREAKPN